MEKIMQTESWDNGVTVSLFGLYCVDVWQMYKGFTSASEKDTPKLSQQKFYCQLVEELIDNNQERISTRNCPRTYRQFDFPQSLASRLSSVPNLRANMKQTTGPGEKHTKYCAQGHCHMCIKARPTILCSLYGDEIGKTLYFCDTHRC